MDAAAECVRQLGCPRTAVVRIAPLRVHEDCGPYPPHDHVRHPPTLVVRADAVAISLAFLLGVFAHAARIATSPAPVRVIVARRRVVRADPCVAAEGGGLRWVLDVRVDTEDVPQAGWIGARQRAIPNVLHPIRPRRVGRVRRCVPPDVGLVVPVPVVDLAGAAGAPRAALAAGPARGGGGGGGGGRGAGGG